MTSSFWMATIGLLGVVGPVWLPLAAQTNLKATATTPTSVTLTWTAAPGATGYVIQRGIGSRGLSRLAGNAGTTYTDPGAPAGTALRYRIKALFSRAEPTFSNVAAVTTPNASPNVAAAPPAPAAPAPATPPAPPPAMAAHPATPSSAGPSLAAAPPAAASPPEAALAPPPGQPTMQVQRLQAPLVVRNYQPAAAGNVTPTNPSGFVAQQTGDGKVKFSWQPVNGVSYYHLFGPGLPGGAVKVSGETTYTASGIPLGSHEWAVGSYYEPGPVSTSATDFSRARLTVDVMLSGWADLHTHPMVNLAFGGNLVHGGVDVGSLLPQDLSCRGPVRATSMAHALSDDRPSHGGWDISFPCGDNLRAHQVIPGLQRANGALVTSEITTNKSPASGSPEFRHWPRWNDITHQKMWFEWIRRARDYGLRVMVALATNNKTLGDAVGPAAGTSSLPTDDKASADLQLTEIKAFVGRHPDFMEIALGPADIKRIVQANKIAVVLGMEIDNIGNFNNPHLRPILSGPAAAWEPMVSGEIQRLYAAGVRYVIPIHVMDNLFGGTAIYENSFNTSNLREAGHFWEIECADIVDNITHTYKEDPDWIRALAAFGKLGMDPFRRSGPGPVCPPEDERGTKSRFHRNARGLTLQGEYAIQQMMKRGMIVDIDHMSQRSADAALSIGERFGYPLVSGHSGIRGFAGASAENSRTPAQLRRISRLHGMFGLGTAGVHSTQWTRSYKHAIALMGYSSPDPERAPYRNGAVAFGTDLNGMVKGPVAGRVQYHEDSFPKSKTGSKTWDYNTEGVAHYGMLADFVRDVRSAPSDASLAAQGDLTGVELVDDHLNRNAHYFWQMWERIEARKGNVQ